MDKAIELIKMALAQYGSHNRMYKVFFIDDKLNAPMVYVYLDTDTNANKPIAQVKYIGDTIVTTNH